MLNSLIKLLEALGAMDMKIAALAVIALAIVAVVVIVSGFGR